MSEVVNYWTILYKHPDGNCICRCRCGRLHKRRYCRIVKGKTKKCGICSRREVAKNNIKEYSTRKDRLYRIWCNIRTRCNNNNCPAYKYYGGRGIIICDEWNKCFDNFKNWAKTSGYKNDLTIDRIDVDGNYCPKNCRWVDRHVQSVNCRIRKDNKTGYKGVFIEKNRFFASIRINRKNIRIGTYDTPEEACIARDKFIIENNLDEYALQILTKKD